MLTRKITLTLVLLMAVILLFEFIDIDIWVQNYLYSVELQQWILNRDEPLSKLIFYDGIKKVFILLIILLIIVLLFIKKNKLIQKYQQGLIIVCISAILIPLVITSLKAITNMPCPKNLALYGGTYPYVTVLSTYPKEFHQTKRIKCYPAGHASGGFALLSLFFLFKSRKSKFIALASVMVLSWSIGIYKMLIGDHFLSHTLVTMILSWLIILMIAKTIFYYSPRKII